ncbi:hypothetical protein RhiJN_00456 [Ceratobasidium sp. AG-Ba]|nr:hypothetical protein RhiJN_00456 [Ceratobasidium sp. AG-Ba]
MSFSWSNSYEDDEYEGNYQLLSSYEYGLSSKEESSERLLETSWSSLNADDTARAQPAFSGSRHPPLVACYPGGCVIVRWTTFRHSQGTPVQFYALRISAPPSKSSPSKLKTATADPGVQDPPSESSSPRARNLLRLKMPLSGRRAARSERSAILDPETSSSSSSSSSRYGSPLTRRSPAPFTPRSVEPLAVPPYDAHNFNPTLRTEPAALDVDMSSAATETTEQDAPEQGVNGAKAQDPLIARLKMPDSMLGHNSRTYSRLP